MRRRQKGIASIILVILTLAIGAAIGIGAFAVTKHFRPVMISQSSPSPWPTDAYGHPRPTPPPVPTPIAIVNPVAGWKTFARNNPTFAFQYPQNWTVKTATSLYANDPKAPVTDVVATGPEGSITFEWGYTEEGGGPCPSTAKMLVKIGLDTQTACRIDNNVDSTVVWSGLGFQGDTPYDYVRIRPHLIENPQNEKVIQSILATVAFINLTSEPSLTPVPSTTQTMQCQSNFDCRSDQTCVAPGPMRADQSEQPKYCYGKNEAIPL